ALCLVGSDMCIGDRDTVRAFNPIEGSVTGFSFDNLSPYWLNWTFQTALDLYRNHPDIWSGWFLYKSNAVWKVQFNQ
ncbi:hypothetical protein AZK28_11295, partial [Streptococcus pneumoniae]